MRAFLLFSFLVISSCCISAQTLSGIILDEHNEPLIGAALYVLQDSVQITGCLADIDGTYSIKLEPGEYVLSYRFVGYFNKEYTIEIKPNQDLRFNIYYRKTDQRYIMGEGIIPPVPRPMIKE